jgi:hypothetical protein
MENNVTMYKAYAIFKDGSRIDTNAEYRNRRWFVGGDVAAATTSLGAKIFIIKNEQIYWLKGNRLIFQDHYQEVK